MTPPVPTPESAEYWAACARRILKLQHCKACERFFFPPAGACPRCWGGDLEWRQVSGRGELYSFVITTSERASGYASRVIAVVELDEGPRLMTNIVGTTEDPDALPIGMPVAVTFVDHAGVMIPVFEPAEEQS